TVERLSNATICEGMIILCRISEITEYELIISIPGGLLGCVKLTDLSEPYTDLLQDIIHTKDVQSDEFKSLSELYNLGDYVVCYVKKIDSDGKWLYNLSLEPQLINQNVNNTNLVTGTKIVCTVKSIEDHGYVIDTGIANVRAFLASKYVSEEKKYFPGNQIMCVIKEIKTVDQVSILTLSAKRKTVNKVSTHDIESLDALMPGTKLSLRITRTLSNGLQVTFGKNNVGYLNRIYLDSPLSTYVNDTEVTGTLLYIMPTVKFAYFSLPTDASDEDSLPIGGVIRKAKVLYRESNGIIFKLTKSNLRGFVSLHRTDVPITKISTVFQPGSVHKCKMISYNWMEHLYVCSMEREILEQKYYSLTDLQTGDTVTVKLTKVDTKSGFVQVQVGKICGFVGPEHVSDSGLSGLNKLKDGDSVEARVLNVNTDKRNVRFTLKQSLIKSKLPVLQDICEARCGQEYHGTIIKINKYGLLVRFYGDVKGWVPRSVLDSNTSDMNWNHTIGQTVTVLIDSIEKEEGKMKLRIITGEQKQQQSHNMKVGELIEGTVVESSLEGIHLRICKTNDSEGVVSGFLPAGHMSPCLEIGALLASKCTPGDTISAYVFSMQPSVIMSRTYMTQGEYRSFDKLKVGDCIPCTIRDITKDGVKVILPIEDYSTFGYVSYKNISNFKRLYIDQILFVKITAINKREKQLTLSMSLKELWDSPVEHGAKMLSAVDVLSLYLNKLSELATNVFYKNKPISSVTLGQKVTGEIERITKYGLVLRLKDNLMGVVGKDHYTSEHKVGDKVFGTILWKNYIHDLVDVSLLPKIVNGISSKQKTLPQLPDTLVLRGQIMMITNWFLLVLVKRHGSGYLVALPVRRHLNDLTPNLKPYTVHAKIRLYVIMKRNECDIIPIGMLKSAFETPNATTVAQSATGANEKQLKRKACTQQDAASSRTSRTAKRPKRNDDDEQAANNDVADKGKLKAQANNTDQSKAVWPKESEAKKLMKTTAGRDSNAKKKRNRKEDKAAEEQTRVKNIDDISEADEAPSDESEQPTNKLSNTEKPHLPEVPFNWDHEPDSNRAVAVSETSSDEEEQSTGEPEQKKKKLSSAERREQERQKEHEIRQQEKNNRLAGNHAPNSIDEFEKLVLSSPNSALVWTKYMAYNLQATIDKSRAVARRAIQTINFQEEQQLLKVWKAWLNMEAKFGTRESLNDVFQEAVRRADDLKVYTHMLNVFLDMGERTELEKLIDVMTHKFKEKPEMWVDCGAALLKIGLKDKSWHIMQRALKSLRTFQHVNLVVQFALLENKLGDKERAHMLFEEILKTYPKRIDVWFTYVDCLVKTEDIDLARKVLKEALCMKLPLKKMKMLFKKYVRFEEAYGTAEDLNRLEQMVINFVENQCSKEST
ncbi:Protein RRP5-like protein, partial [Harpegnathos saltator]